MGPIKLAYFGAGGFSQRQHLPELGKQAEVEVAAVIDPSVENRSNFSLIHSEIKAKKLKEFYSLDDFLRSGTDVDAGVIVTPADSHFEIVSALLRAKKPCYVEKPFMLKITDALLIEDYSSGLKIPVMVGANRCVFPSYRAAANMFKSDAIGGLLGISMYYKHNWEGNTAGNWRQDPNHPASGLLMDHFAHYAHYLVNLGFKPGEARHLGSKYNQAGVDVDTCFYLKDNQGKMAFIVMDGSPSDNKREEEIIIYGTNGRIRVLSENGGSAAYLEQNGKSVRIDNSQAVGEIKSLGIDDVQSHPALLHNFISVIRGENVINASPVSDGVNATYMIQGVAESRGKDRIDTLNKTELNYFRQILNNKRWLNEDTLQEFYKNGERITLNRT